MDRQDERRRAGGGMRLDLGVAYGLVAGGAVGALLLALTGDSMWLAVAPGIGLVLGLAVVRLFGGRDDRG